MKRGNKTAVILLSFGGATSLAEVPDFVASILGRRPPEQVVSAVRERYRAIGGASPLPGTTMRQAQMLQAELAEQGYRWPVYVGMAHGSPSIPEAVHAACKGGARRLVALSLTPYRCQASSTAYEAELEQAAASLDRVEVCVADDWHRHPDYLDGLTRILSDTLTAAGAPSGGEVPVIYAAHGIPRSWIADGDPYVDQLQDVRQALDMALGIRHSYLAFQSESAHTREPWTRPKVLTILSQLSARGVSRVVVAPIGFISDHLETLYDNDIEHQALAERLGIVMNRAPCLNTASELIGALADVLLTTARKGAAQHYGS